MPHSLILGKTESGKTSLAKWLAYSYLKQGMSVIVLDPLKDEWPCTFQTADVDTFNKVVKHPDTKNCAIFIDESGETIGRYNTEMLWLATRARHYGHNSHFIVQRAALLNLTIRTQCKYVYLFNCTFKDAKAIADDWPGIDPQVAVKLPQFHYYKGVAFGRKAQEVTAIRRKTKPFTIPKAVWERELDVF